MIIIKIIYVFKDDGINKQTKKSKMIEEQRCI